MVPTWPLVVEGEQVRRWILRDVLFLCFKKKGGRPFWEKLGLLTLKTLVPKHNTVQTSELPERFGVKDRTSQKQQTHSRNFKGRAD